MKARGIFITQRDKERLDELIGVVSEFGDRMRKDLAALRQELDRAKVVAPRDIHRGVVTMNSRVELEDLDQGETMVITLVFPLNAHPEGGAISVLAPVGTAILGYAEGDVVEWPVPDGMRRLRIRRIVYQPEAAGHFNL